MKVRITRTLNALTMPGMTYTQKELVRFMLRYKTKVGIIPPFTYMVMTQNKDSWERNKKRLRLMM